MATRIRYSAVPFEERKNANTLPDDGKKSNILSVVNPELAKEWHPTLNGSLTPDMVTAGSEKNVWWLGKCGHEWQAIISNRNKGRGCPFCSGRMVLEGFNDLATISPELASEWHPTLNGVLTPSNVTRGSNKKVWWRCKNGHEWQALISNRSKGQGCPFCSNQKVLKGINDLVTVCPEIASEWHTTKNGNLTPDMIMPYSNKKVWWQCTQGHEWQALISNRSKGQGCPFCSGHRILKGFNDLATVNPKLASEWHPTLNRGLTPNDVTCGINKKVWWLGKCGHEWLATIASRNSGIGCPYCSNKRVLKGFNDLTTSNPELVMEWHPSKNDGITPEMITAGSGKKVWWLGKCGHEWQAKISDRSKGHGCPYCSNQKVLKGFNDLATVNPKLASEWHPTKNENIKSIDVTKNSGKKVWWLCDKGHEWQASLNNRSRGNGCPQCQNELHTSFAEQAIYYYVKKIFPDAVNRDTFFEKELDVYIPSIQTAIEYDGRQYHSDLQRDKIKNALCKKHNIRLIRIREKGCPKITGCEVIIRNGHNDDDSLNSSLIEAMVLLGVPCSVDIEKDRADIFNQYIIKNKQNSVTIINPDLAKEWHTTKNGNLTPDMIMPYSNKKVWWQCKKGHEWQAKISDRSKGSGCPYCSNKRVLKGFNDLATVNPKLASEWHPTLNGDLTPNDVVCGTDKKAWWQCKYGHEWQATVSSRSNGNGCPYCAGQKVLKGFNDLVTINPQIASEWHPIKNGDLKPDMFTKGSNKKVWWICPKGHEWQATINKRSNGRGCPICARQKRKV